MRRVPPVALIPFLALIACESKPAVNTDTGTTAGAAPAVAAPAAGASIVSPAEGDSVGSDVVVRLSARGVTVEKAGGTHVEGVGHYHLFLDTPPTADGVVIPPNTATTVHIGSGDSTYTFKGVAPGAHELIVVLGHGDHVPMMTMARDTVRFVVKK
jgi:hypothetical protein